MAHPILKKFLERSQPQLLEGKRIASLFLKAPGIKTYTYQLLVLGEKTGRFAVVLQQVVSFHEEEALRLQEKILIFLQPMCLAFLGLFILSIEMGTILPLYEHLPEISGATL